MGFRYRKSINLGGGFRVNISKSGIGYSWGVKGYRITKTAKGNVRETYTLPFGVSYVTETKNTSKQGNRTFTSSVPTSNTFNETKIENNISETSVGLKKILGKVQLLISVVTALYYAALVLFGFSLFLAPVLWLLFVPACILLVYLRSFYHISLEYNIDEDVSEKIQKNFHPFELIAKCNSVWRINLTKNVKNTKYTSGADLLVGRMKCEVSNDAIYPFKTNIKPVVLTCGKEALMFLPDMVVVFNDKIVDALSYDDINMKVAYANFVETENIPKDAKVVGYTWKYTNKKGGQDKRFKDNKEYPLCSYGYLKLTAQQGLNTIIMFSRSSIIADFGAEKENSK